MKDEKKLLVVKTLRISEELNTEIAKAAQKLDSAEQDIIRLCLKIGLKHLEAVKYDIAMCILGSVLNKNASSSVSDDFNAALGSARRGSEQAKWAKHQEPGKTA